MGKAKGARRVWVLVVAVTLCVLLACLFVVLCLPRVFVLSFKSLTESQGRPRTSEVATRVTVDRYVLELPPRWKYVKFKSEVRIWSVDNVYDTVVFAKVSGKPMDEVEFERQKLWEKYLSGRALFSREELTRSSHVPCLYVQHSSVNWRGSKENRSSGFLFFPDSVGVLAMVGIDDGTYLSYQIRSEERLILDRVREVRAKEPKQR